MVCGRSAVDYLLVSILGWRCAIAWFRRWRNRQSGHGATTDSDERGYDTDSEQNMKYFDAARHGGQSA
jgi:hypothetical protein